MIQKGERTSPDNVLRPIIVVQAKKFIVDDWIVSEASVIENSNVG